MNFCCQCKYFLLKSDVIWDDLTPTMSAHNTTSFICNICLERLSPTQTQHPGNQRHSTHNQPLKHKSALVLCLSLFPPALYPLLEALVKWVDPLTAGRTPILADDRSDQDLGQPEFPCTCREWGQMAALAGLSVCYHRVEGCFWPDKKVTTAPCAFSVSV